jgi:hypothetical protein
MMTTIALLTLVIVVEAVPVYAYLRANWLGRPITANPTMVMSFGLVVAICVLATIVPLRVGLKKMEGFEF